MARPLNVRKRQLCRAAYAYGYSIREIADLFGFPKSQVGRYVSGLMTGGKAFYDEEEHHEDETRDLQGV